MFKNHSVQVKVVKDEQPKHAAPPSPFENAHMELIHKLSNMDAKRTAQGGVAVFAAVVAINTLSKVIVNICPTN